MRAMRIALLEDDADHARHIAGLLESAGHAANVFSRGRQLLAELTRESYDVVVLDWVVPDVSGFDVLRAMRGQQALDTPVLFLTSRNSETDVVQALDAGADDFLVKPPRERELLSRVAALGRRSHGLPAEEEVIEIEPFRVEVAARRMLRDGAPVELTPREFDVALFFFRNAGRVVSRSHILETVWGRSAEVATRTLDTHVSRLRAALGLSSETGLKLTPVYGYGYRLESVARSGA
jgi:DNA-binding response OmpR family regulator